MGGSAAIGTETVDKRCSLEQAVAEIAPGSLVGIGGLTLYRRPVAAVREIARAGIGNLTLLGLTLGFEADLLVGAGLARRVRTSYFGLEAFGLAPMFTQAAGDGNLEVVEETEASIVFGLRAAMARVGFMPSRAWAETDLPRVRKDVRTVEDPYTGDVYTAFPAIAPDVAIVHAREADALGNAVLGGNLAVDRELSTASPTVIVTAEKVVETLSAEADILGQMVTFVVPLPRGAQPTSCYPDYPLDAAELLRYVEACRDGKFRQYLKAWLET